MVEADGLHGEVHAIVVVVRGHADAQEPPRPTGGWRQDARPVPDEAFVQKGGGVPVERGGRIDLTQDLQQGLGRERPIAGRIAEAPARVQVEPSPAGSPAVRAMSPRRSRRQSRRRVNANESTGRSRLEPRPTPDRTSRARGRHAGTLWRSMPRDRSRRIVIVSTTRAIVGPSGANVSMSRVDSRGQLSIVCVTSRVRRRHVEYAALRIDQFERDARQGSPDGKICWAAALVDFKVYGGPCRGRSDRRCRPGRRRPRQSLA